MNTLTPPPVSTLARAALLASAALTVVSGTTLAPALPAIRDTYASMSGAETLARLVVTVPALAIALTAPFAGRLADRIGRRAVLVGSLALYAVAGASGLFIDGLVWILVGRALLGVAAAGAMTSSTAIAVTALGPEERARFLARQASVMSLAGVLSVAFGGLLAAHHWRAPFVTYLAAVPVAALALRCIVEPPRPPPGQNEPAPGPDPVPGLAQRAPIYAITLVAMAFVFMVPLQIPFMLVHDGPSAGGLAVAMTTLFAAASALLFTRPRARSFAPTTWLTRSFVVMGTGYLVVGTLEGTGPMLVGLALAGTGSGWIMPQISRWLVAATSERSRSASVGVLTSSVYAGQFVSPPLAALLGAGRSVQHAFALAGGVLVVLAIAAFVTARLTARWTTRP